MSRPLLAIALALSACGVSRPPLPPVQIATEAAPAPALPSVKTTTRHDDALAIAAGTWHACAVRSDSSVWCWGYNGTGQLGDGTFEPSGSPVLVRELRGARSLSVANRTSCAVTDQGRVACWGNGDTWAGKVSRPPAVANVASEIEGVAQVAVGEYHVCVRLTSGKLMCTQDGTFTHGGVVRTALPEVTDATDLCSGYMQACAVRSNGEVWCWGDPHGKTLSISYVEPPGVRIALDEPAKKVACGHSSSCAVLASGRVACWGEPYDANPNVPVIVPTPPAFDIGASLSLVCVAHEDGVACWNQWPGGPGPPRPVPGLGRVSAIAVGFDFACARVDRDVVCWGRNDRGQLGVGTRASHKTPVRVLVPQ